MHWETKNIHVTRFVILALLWWSGTDPALPPRSACTIRASEYFTYRSWDYRQALPFHLTWVIPRNTDTSINSHPGPGSLLHCCPSPPTSVNSVNTVVPITPWTSRSGNVALNSSLWAPNLSTLPLKRVNLLKTCPPFTSPCSFVPSGQLCWFNFLFFAWIPW